MFELSSECKGRLDCVENGAHDWLSGSSFLRKRLWRLPGALLGSVWCRVSVGSSSTTYTLCFADSSLPHDHRRQAAVGGLDSP